MIFSDSLNNLFALQCNLLSCKLLTMCWTLLLWSILVMMNVSMITIMIMKNVRKMSIVNQNVCLAMMRASSCGLVNGSELYGDDLIREEPGS